MKDPQQLRALLANYYGSENLYPHALVRRFSYTDGVKAFADNAGGGAYWLVDIMATQPEILERARLRGFVIVVLYVRDGKARLTACDDTDDVVMEGVAYTREISYTDCPEGTWKFYIVSGQGYDGRDFTALLPGEY